MLRIRIQAIVVFDDGVPPTSGPASLPGVTPKSWGDYVKELVDDTNALWEREDVPFRADFHPKTDVAFLSSTLVNRDDTDDESAMEFDLNGNQVRAHQYARQLECWKYPGRLVVFFRDYKSAISEDPVHSSSSGGDFVYFDKVADDLQGNPLAHELGHFFHLPHTFDQTPKTISDAKDAIRKFVDDGSPISKGDEVFDGDAPAISDTPPDPGIALFINQSSDGKSRCEKRKIEITMKFSGKEQTYVLKPDRSNLMSYFNYARDPACPQPRTLSADQKSVMEAALRTGNRNGLLHTAAMIDEKRETAWFFKADRYIRYDVKNDRAMDGYPKQISDGWPGLWERHIDAAAIWPDGRTYFFKGDEYVKYDRDQRKVFKNYPLKIADEWPGIWKENLDAAVVLNDETAYFFKEAECQRYDIKQDKAVGKPEPIGSRWPGVWGAGIDSALDWTDGKIYFFKGDRFARYDQSERKLDQSSQRIDGNWPGLWTQGIGTAVVWNDGTIRFVSGDDYIKFNILGFEPLAGYPRPLTKIDWQDFPWTLNFAPGLRLHAFDAGAVWNNGKAYFFKDNEYVRVDLDKNKVDQEPRLIKDHWEGLGGEIWPGEQAAIDAVVLWNNGKAYFFRGDHYFQVDPDKKKVIAGPLSIKEYWKGVFHSDIDAVIALWDRGKAYFFKGNEYIRYDIAADRADDGYPVRIGAGAWRGLTWD